MENVRSLRRHLDNLYAELAELRRYIVLHERGENTRSRKAWSDLVEASEEISAMWTGPGALDEIRSQREK